MYIAAVDVYARSCSHVVPLLGTPPFLPYTLIRVSFSRARRYFLAYVKTCFPRSAVRLLLDFRPPPGVRASDIRKACTYHTPNVSVHAAVCSRRCPLPALLAVPKLQAARHRTQVIWWRQSREQWGGCRLSRHFFVGILPFVSSAFPCCFFSCREYIKLLSQLCWTYTGIDA